MKSKKIRILCMILSATLVLFAFAGCGDKKEPSDKEKTSSAEATDSSNGLKQVDAGQILSGKHHGSMELRDFGAGKEDFSFEIKDYGKGVFEIDAD